MTDRELMGLHAEIMSLRDILGTSYKDACHRLYMAEWEKLKRDDRMQKAFSLLTNRTREALGNFQARLGELGREGNRTDNADADADAPSLLHVATVQ